MAKRIWRVMEPNTATGPGRITFLTNVDIDELHKVPFLKALKCSPHIRLATQFEIDSFMGRGK